MNDKWHALRAVTQAFEELVMAERKERTAHEPKCEYCGGGEYFWHTLDCTSIHCALAGGYDDCRGVVVQCGCQLGEG